MTVLAAHLAAIPEAAGRPPWPDHEFVRGWGAFALPFDSGHVLALRVFPQGTFGPYRSVWHRDPAGDWSIYTDAPHPAFGCARYFGPAAVHCEPARIHISWTGPRSLLVELDEPALTWTITTHTTPALALLNALSSLMPMAAWRPDALLRAREGAARALGMGRLHLRGRTPSGHVGTLMPERMYFIDTSRALLGGQDLGHPVRLDHNPTIGDVPLPARGVLARGQAVWRLIDDTGGVA